MSTLNQYTTRDFYLAAYLVASGNELQSYRKDAMNLTTFIFHNSLELQQEVKRYYALEATVNPVEYGNAQRNLKSIIHENQMTNPNRYYVEHSK